MTKDDYINILFEFTREKFGNIDKILHSLESFVSENEYDVQTELILHAFRTYKKANISNCFEDICEVAAPIFELLKTTDWGFVEIYILTTVIIYTPHHITSEDFKNEALDILNDEFRDHKEYDKITSTLHLNLSMRHLRAKYYDGADPQEVKALFNQCVNVALPIYEKGGKTTLRTILLLRKALFDGDCEKISEHLNALEATGNRALIEITRGDVVEFLYHLGDRITKPLLDYQKGYKMKMRRKEIGMSTMELAEALNTSQIIINGYERGDRGIGNTRLHKAAKILGVDVTYFYGDINRKHVEIVTDITAHKINQLVAELSEKDKEYFLEIARIFVRHTKEPSPPEK